MHYLEVIQCKRFLCGSLSVCVCVYVCMCVYVCIVCVHMYCVCVRRYTYSTYVHICVLALSYLWEGPNGEV